MKGRRRILVIEDEVAMRSMLQDQLEADFDLAMASSGDEGLQYLQREPTDLVLLGLGLPDKHGLQVLRDLGQRLSQMPAVVVIAADHDRSKAVEAVRNGAYDYLIKPVTTDRLRTVLERAHERMRLLRENVALRQTLQASQQFRGLLGSSQQVLDLKRQIEKVADSRGTVLLTGQSGTGKELAARAIHELSGRRNGPYVKINCSAVTETLLEGELFGHEKGAFANAHTRKEGLFEVAHGGTFLLDDISYMPQSLQPRLLHVLQEREFMRVGGKTPIKVDVRIIATTSKDLRLLVREGKFKEDLFYRLNVIPIEICPLSERRDDIPILARHFVERACAENGRPLMTITPAALEAMVAYSWPGNVRELENSLERTVILNEGDTIDAGDLRLDNDALLHRSPSNMDKDDLTLRELEKQLILRRLSLTGGNRTRAAQMLGISVRTLRNKINQYRGEGIQIPG